MILILILSIVLANCLNIQKSLDHVDNNTISFIVAFDTTTDPQDPQLSDGPNMCRFDHNLLLNNATCNCESSDGATELME